MFASSQLFHDNRCTPKIVAKLFHENLYTHKLSCGKSNLQKTIHRLFSTKLSITTTVNGSGIRLSTTWTTNSTGLAHQISEATINLYIRLSRTPSHSAPSQNIWSSIGSSWDLSCWKYWDVGKIPYNPPDKVWVVFDGDVCLEGFGLLFVLDLLFALTNKDVAPVILRGWIMMKWRIRDGESGEYMRSKCLHRKKTLWKDIRGCWRDEHWFPWFCGFSICGFRAKLTRIGSNICSLSSFQDD